MPLDDPSKDATATPAWQTTITKPPAKPVAKPAAAPKKAPTKAAPKKAPAKPAATNWAVGENIVTASAGGLTFQVAASAKASFEGFINALIAAGYQPTIVQGYNNRSIAGTAKKSNHAYGAAIDIDPGQNPRYASGAGGKFALPPDVGQIAARFGLNWGGDYKNSKDYMHFEVAGAPASKGGSGGTEPADTSTGAEPHAVTAEVKDKVAQDYGYLAAFLDNPELGPLLMQAAKEGWDASRLQGALYKTKWYQTHSAVTREFDSQTKLDPATQKQAIEKQIFDITAQAKRAGIGLSHAQLAQLGWTSLRYGWSAQQLTNAIVAQGKMDLSGKNPNASLTTAANLKEAAAQYMVPVSDAQLQTWVKQIQAGELSINDFSGYLKEQAKSLFPGLSASIDRGVTVEQYADPYRNIAAQTLEVDPQSIDFMHDPKYQKALFQLDPKTKDRTSMSLADWGTYLRGLPEYGKTAQANQQAAGMATSILNVFGKVAS